MVDPDGCHVSSASETVGTFSGSHTCAGGTSRPARGSTAASRWGALLALAVVACSVQRAGAFSASMVARGEVRNRLWSGRGETLGARGFARGALALVGAGTGFRDIPEWQGRGLGRAGGGERFVVRMCDVAGRGGEGLEEGGALAGGGRGDFGSRLMAIKLLAPFFKLALVVATWMRHLWLIRLAWLYRVTKPDPPTKRDPPHTSHTRYLPMVARRGAGNIVSNATSLPPTHDASLA